MTTSRKKQWEVIKRSKRSKDVKGFLVGEKKLEFGTADAMILHDGVLAQEVEEKYGKHGSKDVVVVEVDDADPHAENRGGRRTRKLWTINLPWKQ